MAIHSSEQIISSLIHTEGITLGADEVAGQVSGMGVITRMNGHCSSSNNPDNLPLLVVIQTESHQFLFNSCWNGSILHNLPPLPNINHII